MVSFKSFNPECFALREDFQFISALFALSGGLEMDGHRIVGIFCPYSVFVFCEAVSKSPFSETDIETATFAIQSVNDMCCIAISIVTTVKCFFALRVLKSFVFIYVTTMVASTTLECVKVVGKTV